MSTLEMTRTFAASQERVFMHLTQTEFLLNWWGPEGTTIADHALSFATPGPWSATMVGPQGHGATVGGQVREVDPPNMVELTLSFALENDTRGPESVIRFTLVATADGHTELTLTQSGLNPDHIADMRDKGWNAALARLERLVTAS
jgi:uncharacterized protein YndB with AHSA1/START domain